MDFRDILSLSFDALKKQNHSYSVLIEALLIGIFGATFGLPAGIGMGYALSATF
jgi:ABC-type antimicrobial peptide transport system permease subunit